MARGSILVIDDEADILEMIELGLSGEGYAVQLANGGTHALSLIAERPPDLVICDIKMPGLDGIATISRLREVDPSLPAIVLTGYLSPHTLEECDKLGRIQVLRKPFVFRELSTLVETSLRLGRAKTR
jgi:CheY-like chemotaxis protein